MDDWLKFFVDTIGSINERLAVVVNAAGCREGWLQGELFIFGREHGLRVNRYSLGHRQTADLSCGEAPDMVAEIKIVGAHYFPKMRGYIEADVQRMLAVSKGTQRFMILVIPRSDDKTPLGEYLHSCCFSPNCVEKEWPGFYLRIWQL
jgi:hypothetical protein